MNNIHSLYFHFPFCRHLCNYCDFYKHKLETYSQVREFETLLLEQWEQHKIFLEDHKFKLGKIDTIYIGGGTPSLWGKDGADFFSSFLKSEGIELSKSCEFTIEVDPDVFSEETVKSWIKIGANRFSIGVQSYSNKLLEIMDRQHCLKDVDKCLKYFDENNINYSVDLMLGLPNSSDRVIQEELEALLAYSPSHFSVYILKTRKNYPHREKLPLDDQIRDEYLFVSKYLRSKGYDHYEISNFAKEGKFSKHNIKYWDYTSVGAVGPNATGLLVETNHALRYQWKSISAGFQVEKIEGESLTIEKLFLGLRHRFGFDINKLFLIKDHQALDKIYDNWDKMDYLDVNSSRESIVLSSLGFLMCDSLIDDIFKKIDF